MSRPSAILGSLFFLLLAPGTVAGVVPWWISRWYLQRPLLGFSGFRLVGALLISIGVPILLDSFRRFALQGMGTPAPVFPTQRLVVTGLYRYLRNPMYFGVTAVIFGQGLLLGNVRLLEYGLVVWLVFHVFVLAYEERTLRGSFGDEYSEFCRNVPRWIPRLTPWSGR